jgi:hypothetical protein
MTRLFVRHTVRLFLGKQFAVLVDVWLNQAFDTFIVH